MSGSNVSIKVDSDDLFRARTTVKEAIIKKFPAMAKLRFSDKMIFNIMLKDSLGEI